MSALEFPPLCSALDRLLGRPRALQLAAVAVCGLLLWRSLAGGSVGVAQSDQATAADPPAGVATAASVESQPASAPEQAVERYNRASAEAARRGRADLLAPYLDPLGPAWAAAQAEYARRLARRELHDPTLRRWGVLKLERTSETATLVTQELWDDVVRTDGLVTSSARGVLTRNTYTLRHAPAGWLVVDVATEPLVR